MICGHILFCNVCGYIAEPDTAQPNKCPSCGCLGLCIATDETAAVLNVIRMRTQDFK